MIVGGHTGPEKSVCAQFTGRRQQMSVQGVRLSPNCAAPPGTLLTNRPRGDGGGGGEAMKVEEKTEERAKV